MSYSVINKEEIFQKPILRFCVFTSLPYRNSESIWTIKFIL